MPHDSEQKRAAGRTGGQNSRAHGVYALQERGEAALDAKQKGTFLEIEQELEAPEGIVTALRRRAAMGLMVLQVLEGYLEEQVNAGTPLDAIPILKSWPAFQNSTVRSLKDLQAVMPKPVHDALSDEVQKIKKLVDDAVDDQVEDSPEDRSASPGANGAAQESERD